ncbi:MAG: hypothetical protein HZA91_18070 [Verrucomicrobia bacterium]|nr:hypothetical protein [Verrucomicrobiota bacterium]
MNRTRFAALFGQVVAALICLAANAASPPLWIHAREARAMSPLMVPASRVALGEADAMGDFILPAITATAETPAPESWAEFAVEVPKSGAYHLWGRVRFPAGATESFRIAPANAAADGREIILGAGKDARRWHWVNCGELKLPAGPWTFRVHPHRAAATTFGPLKWRKAELTQTPRLNALCLSDNPDFNPTDADAQRALGVTTTKPLSPRVVPAKLSPLPADGPLVENRKRVPDWMRVPRWFTKDSWRDELQHRRAGDIAALVREVAANGGEALRLSVFWGGEAYFQSRVAPHAPGLGKLDYLREAMDESARTGAKVVVYMNPNALVGEHPLRAECAIREPDGRLSTQPAYGRQDFPGGSRYACVNHPRYRQFLRDVLTEIFTRYKAHGLYVDGLTPHVCFCEHCRAKWRAMFGSEMPVEKLGKNPPSWAVWGEFGRDPQPVGDVENDPDARRWTEMMLRSLVEVTHEFSVTVKHAKPDAVTLFHSHPKPGSDDDYDGTLTEVYTPRPWVHIAWRSGELAGYSAVYHVPVLFNIYPHRHFTAAEARYHALQGLAAGAYPNFWSALGMKPVAGFMARCADYLDFDSAAPVKFLALPRDLRDSDTQRKTPRGDGVSYGSRDRFLAPYVGAYSALMRSGLPVVTLHRPRFEEDLAGFKVLMLANVALMSDAQVEAVRHFVRDGGGLVATHETSLYDEKGGRRPDFALADVLGVNYKTTLKSPGQDEPCASVEQAGAETADWQPNGKSVMTHRYGKGRIVYLPGRPDSMQCYNPSAQIERLFAKAVRWVAQGAVPVEVEAAGVVGVTLFRQPRRLIVHLVNHQRDSLFRSDACEPVAKLSLRVRVPADCRVQRVRRLWENRDLPFEVRDNAVRVEVGRLDEYEAVAVEW